MNTPLRIGKSYRHQLLYICLIPAFFVGFSFLYNPFGMKEYYQIGGMGFGFHFIILATILMAVLAITRLIFSAIYRHTPFLWWHYTIWCFGEVFVYSFFMLSLLALLWSIYSIIYFKHHHKNIKKLGNLVLCETNQSFYDLHNQPVKLTPMQEQLMRMFFHADNHQLSKQKICNALWPKKPDASETLYTLIRRLKPIAEEKGNLEIISERGKDYQLRVRS